MNLTGRDIANVIVASNLDGLSSSIAERLLVRAQPMSLSKIEAELPKAARSTVARSLRKLVAQGVISKVGSGPRAAYEVNSRWIAQQFLSVDFLKRSAKYYDSSLLLDYVPNRTRLLPIELAKDLRAVSDGSIGLGATMSSVVSRRMLIDMAWASSRLEGNTYTLLDTRNLIDNGVVAGDKTLEESIMILNHASAIDYVVTHAANLTVTPMEVRSLHKQLSSNLLTNPRDEGALRQCIVTLGKTAYKPTDDPHELSKYLDMICEKVELVEDPYEQSMFLLTHIAYLQPFIDVNKRTGRVAASIPLLRRGLCPLSFYGIDEDGYIKGLVAFYELGDSTLLADAYSQGYRAAAERFKTYQVTLNANLDAFAQKYRQEIRGLVRAFVLAVNSQGVFLNDEDNFLRTRIREDFPTLDRDGIALNARAILHDLDPVSGALYNLTTTQVLAFQQHRHLALSDPDGFTELAKAEGRPSPS